MLNVGGDVWCIKDQLDFFFFLFPHSASFSFNKAIKRHKASVQPALETELGVLILLISSLSGEIFITL